MLTFVLVLLTTIALFAQSDRDNPTPPKEAAPEVTPNSDGSEVYVQVIRDALGMMQYRWFNQDLDWTHTFDPTGKGVVSATLEIVAWDVDLAHGEIDLVYADGVLLGNLVGHDSRWSTTKFDVPVHLLKDGALKVFIDIDSTHQEYWWAVAIGWSKLTVVWEPFNLPNRIIASIPVGSMPGYVAINPVHRIDGEFFAYVSNKGDGTISVINLRNYTVFSVIATGGQPNQITFTPEGNFAFVCDQLRDVVYVIDSTPQSRTFNSIIATVPFLQGAKPNQVAINNVLNEAYITLAGTNKVAVMDTSNPYQITFKQYIDLPLSPTDAVVTPDFSKLYVSLGRKIAVIDTEDKSITKFTDELVLFGKEFLNDLALSADGKYLYAININLEEPVSDSPYAVSHYYGGFLIIIDTTTDEEISSSVTHQIKQSSIAVNPFLPLVYVASSEEHAIAIVKVEDIKDPSRDFFLRTKDDAKLSAIAFTPSGERFLAVDKANNKVYITGVNPLLIDATYGGIIPGSVDALYLENINPDIAVNKIMFGDIEIKPDQIERHTDKLWAVKYTIPEYVKPGLYKEYLISGNLVSNEVATEIIDVHKELIKPIQRIEEAIKRAKERPKSVLHALPLLKDALKHAEKGKYQSCWENLANANDKLNDYIWWMPNSKWNVTPLQRDVETSLWELQEIDNGLRIFFQ